MKPYHIHYIDQEKKGLTPRDTYFWMYDNIIHVYEHLKNTVTNKRTRGLLVQVVSYQNDEFCTLLEQLDDLLTQESLQEWLKLQLGQVQPWN